MQQVVAQVVSASVYDAFPTLHRLHLAAPTLVAGMRPGQLLLADTEADYVRRPFFPITLNDDGLSLLLPPGSPLRRLGPGDELDCLGPLGKGFPLPPHAHNLLLLAQAGGFGVAGLQAEPRSKSQQNGVTFLLTLIDQALAAGRNVLLIHEAPTVAQLFPPTDLPPGVEVRLATADGSQGQTGAALDLLPELAQWADQVYAVGTPEWYAALVRALRDHRLRLIEGLAWGLIAPEILPCGMGVCGGCAVETRKGYQLPCSDGPVFDLTKV
jgi:dihydroorotate dehydrogenase electron transfer subunit